MLKNLRTIRRQMRECQEDVAAWRPDVLVAVDYPGFNMKMARWAKEHGIRVFYYIAPKVWAWREWRVKAIREYVDRLFVIFPFERDYFPRHGIRPVFEGNPLMDAIEARRPSLPSPAEFRRKHRWMTVRSSPSWPEAAGEKSATTCRSWCGSPDAFPNTSSS